MQTNRYAQRNLEARQQFESFTSTVSLTGTVRRAGSYNANGISRFVFTIQRDCNSDNKTEVFYTAGAESNYLAFLLINASQVAVGDKVLFFVNINNPETIEFIETIAPSEEEARELDRT